MIKSPPPAYTLMQIEEAQTLGEAVNVVIQYAEVLHHELLERDNISRVGGTNITVHSVDKIALSQKSFLKEEFPEADVQFELAKALKQTGHELSVYETQERRFKEAAENIAGLKKDWKEFCERKEGLETEIQVHEDLCDHEREGYLKYVERQVNKLTSERINTKTRNPITRFLAQNKNRNIANQIKDLESDKIRRSWSAGECSKECARTAREELELHMKEGFPAVKFPWEQEDGTAKIHHIMDENMFATAIQSLNDYTNDPDVIAKYKNAASILRRLETQEQQPNFQSMLPEGVRTAKELMKEEIQSKRQTGIQCTERLPD